MYICMYIYICIHVHIYKETPIRIPKRDGHRQVDPANLSPVFPQRGRACLQVKNRGYMEVS